MSDISRCASIPSSIQSNTSSACSNSNDSVINQHPLSSESGHPIEILTRTIQVDYPRRRPESIRSIPTNGAMSRHRKTQSSITPSSRTSNERNLIFDDWVTSTAHPTLAAHSLIPENIVDDDRAVQNMLAEAMSEEHFGSVLQDIRPSTPASAIDVPVGSAEVSTRPRSSSGLSMRKWAGIFVGRGDSARRPESASGQKARQQPTQQRSSSAPNAPAPEDIQASQTTTEDTEGTCI
jgi:hypothetical protein